MTDYEAEKAGTKLKKVLLVDDSPTIKIWLKGMLSMRYPGVEFVEAKEGLEGRKELGRNLVDLVITDLEMEGMSGPQFIEWIKEHPVLKKKRVIAYSGKITPEFEAQIAGYPRIAAVPKSQNPDRLYQTIDNLMNQ